MSLVEKGYQKRKHFEEAKKHAEGEMEETLMELEELLSAVVRDREGDDVAVAELPEAYADESDDDEYNGRPSIFDEATQDNMNSRHPAAAAAGLPLPCPPPKNTLASAEWNLRRARTELSRSLNLPQGLSELIADFAVSAVEADSSCLCGGSRAGLRWSSGSQRLHLIRCSHCQKLRSAQTNVALIVSSLTPKFVRNSKFHVQGDQAVRIFGVSPFGRTYSTVHLDEWIEHGATNYSVHIERASLRGSGIAVGCIGQRSLPRLNATPNWLVGVEPDTAALCRVWPVVREDRRRTTRPPNREVEHFDAESTVVLDVCLDVDERQLTISRDGSCLGSTALPLDQPVALAVSLMFDGEAVSVKPVREAFSEFHSKVMAAWC